MTEVKLKALKRLKESPDGEILSEYIQEEIDKLDSVKGITTIEETLGKQYAIATLEKMRSFFRKTPPKIGKNDYS